MDNQGTEHKPGGNPTIEQMITSKLEGALKPGRIKDQDRTRSLKLQIAALQTESKEVHKAQLDMGLGEMATLFFTKKPSTKVAAAYVRQAEIQAELAAKRLERGAAWKVVLLDIPNKLAIIACSEILAKYSLQDAQAAKATSFDVTHKRYSDGRYYSEVAWPFSLARNWMNKYLLPVIPEQVKSHMRLASIASWSFSIGSSQTEDWLFLPSRADLRANFSDWGKLDERSSQDFWLRDTGQGVGQSGQNVLRGNTESYSPAVYDYGIQPLAVVDLTSFPAIAKMLAGDMQ